MCVCVFLTSVAETKKVDKRAVRWSKRRLVQLRRQRLEVGQVRGAGRWEDRRLLVPVRWRWKWGLLTGATSGHATASTAAETRNTSERRNTDQTVGGSKFLCWNVIHSCSCEYEYFSLVLCDLAITRQLLQSQLSQTPTPPSPLVPKMWFIKHC